MEAALRTVSQMHATMVTYPKLRNAWQNVIQVNKERIEGDIVEAGVFRGGTSMLMSLADLNQDNMNRTIWLYDTFNGLPPPSDKDDDRSKKRWKHALSVKGAAADAALERGMEHVDKNGKIRWNYAPFYIVKENMKITKHPRVKYVQGMVESSLLNWKSLPKSIAILRLDTDWYNSTQIELNVLFPLLSVGGYLIIDDYCTWGGARRATKEWLENNKHLLKIIDSSYSLCFLARKIRIY